jgi:hypothetical protein|tara:strand:- start:529 stop:1266 length:738 start_codon:yes stop_codon:yes gene_type:complete
VSKIKSLEGANIALVAMGTSQLDFHLSKSYSVEYDEVWGINAMAGITECDRVFMLDPASRFLDSDAAGSQTGIMTKVLTTHQGPIYTCELDERCPGLVEYPLLDVVKETRCSYLNNTVPFAIAFALYNKVARLNVFGVDFTYKGNLHFAEAGRSCVEFWLAKCIENNMIVSVAPRSGLLDTDVPVEEKLYGYHRLEDPTLVLIDEDEDEFFTMGFEEYNEKLHQKRLDEATVGPMIETPPEAKRY